MEFSKKELEEKIVKSSSEENLEKLKKKTFNLIEEREIKYGSSLRCQGLNNELIHHINAARKKLDLVLNEKFILEIGVEEDLVELVTDAFNIERLYVLKETFTTSPSITIFSPDADYVSEKMLTLKFEGNKYIGNRVSKISIKLTKQK